MNWRAFAMSFGVSISIFVVLFLWMLLVLNQPCQQGSPSDCEAEGMAAELTLFFGGAVLVVGGLVISLVSAVLSGVVAKRKEKATGITILLSHIAVYTFFGVVCVVIGFYLLLRFL